PPLLKIRLPLPHRLNCFLRLWALKFLVSIVFAVERFRHPLPKHQQPTLIKRYPCRPGLDTRIFYPPNYKSGDLLPVYLVMHGGGFAVADPRHDDEFCASWAKRTGMLVVDLNYSKAPLNPFPAPVYDVAALARAVLDDTSLPINKSRVAIGGFSSGGNLALTASQLPELKGLVNAALVFYPIVDWGHPPDEKLARRPYKGGPDSLEETAYWFDWAYVSVGQDRHAPLLSPYYARKEDLPPWICIVGAQWDMLRLEAQKMAHELAEINVLQEESFEKGRYKWVLAKGCSHGFTHHLGQKEPKRKKREAKCEPIYEDTASWLSKA
ncbi:Alpha/Beta hydrolase protein, partial [Stachybotrys elegans]